MTYNLDDYRRTVTPVIKQRFENSRSKPVDEIGIIAIITGAPILVVGYLMLEILGPNEELSKMLERTEKFYA